MAFFGDISNQLMGVSSIYKLIMMTNLDWYGGSIAMGVPPNSWMVYDGRSGRFTTPYHRNLLKWWMNLVFSSEMMQKNKAKTC